MTEDTKYNGWTNWTTWNANLWLTNESWTDESARELVREAIASYDPAAHTYNTTPEEHQYAACRDAGKALAEWFDETYVGELGGNSDFSGPVADAWTHYIGDVNWTEIAEHYAEE